MPKLTKISDNSETGKGQSMSQLVATRALWISASLLPLPLLMAAATSGGIFTLLAMIYMTFAIIFIDEMSDVWRSGTTQSTAELTRDFFPMVLGIAHFAILGTAVHALGNSEASGLEWVLNLYAFGLFFGVISFANAAQLNGRSSHLHRKLGEWIYASLMFGYYSPADRQNQLDGVGQSADPFTAQTGESFYKYLVRAIPSTVKSGLKAEANWKDHHAKQVSHPFITRLGIGILFLALTAWMAGFKAMIGLLIVSAIAQTITYLAYYVRRYGLATSSDDANSNTAWVSPKILLPLGSKLSDRAGQLMNPSEGSNPPQLPFSLMTMCFVALRPSLWQKLMDSRVAVWQDTNHFRNI